jgi:hypothetical protein
MAATRSKPRTTTTVIRHGGRNLRVPVLSGPVGPESPSLRAKYPRMNQPADLGIVDYYLSAIEAVRTLGPDRSENPMGLSRLLGIVDKNVRWVDRNSAITVLQGHLPEIADDEEKRLGIIKPDALGAPVGTWRAIVDLGDTAEKLLGDASTLGPTKYIHTGLFDRALFADAYRYEFKSAPPGDIFRLLRMMEVDAYVIDIRWMAYMFGTCYVETGRKFAPVDELGKGDLGYRVDKKTHLRIHRGYKAYYLPAKVLRLTDGRVRVTEQDGDQFLINADGVGYTPVAAGASRGANAVRAATSIYLTDPGIERRYYGRGYVQVTWWNTYAEAGAALGRGLEFLLDPDRVKDPQIAYAIMSLGMRTGSIFANKQTLAKFITGTHCDYFHARQMVNGLSGAQEIADHAVSFERILLASKHVVLA